LINRLYLDALSTRLERRFTAAMHGMNASGTFPLVTGVIAVGAALLSAGQMTDVPVSQIAVILVVALLLPLFPLHGIYVAALTRAPEHLAAVLAVLLPAAGMYGLASLVPELPAESLRTVSALAVFGALYGSFKALAAVRAPQLLAYAGLAFFSALWWHFARVGTIDVQAIVYGGAASFLIAALLLAWRRAQRGCGDLALDRMHGLARPMPRFATMVSLLIMAAVGLPPFGLFSAYIAMLLQPADAISWELIVILIAWFLASWYLFRMMQRLLFGPHRADLRYEDLRTGELASFAFLLLILAFLGAIPPEALESQLSLNDYRVAMENVLWSK
jgi:NADH-quinone oxidoreductase subunit M